MRQAPVAPKDLLLIREEIQGWQDIWWDKYNSKAHLYALIHPTPQAVRMAYSETKEEMDAYNSGKPLQEKTAA